MAYRRRRRSGGGMRRMGRTYRPRGYSVRGRGRYRGRTRRAGSTLRLVIQTPSDMLPLRPQAAQFARLRRRARF